MRFSRETNRVEEAYLVIIGANGECGEAMGGETSGGIAGMKAREWEREVCGLEKGREELEIEKRGIAWGSCVWFLGK